MRLLVRFGCVVAIAAAAGCASSDPGRERATKAVSGLQDTRGSVAEARKQVDKTITAANQLQSGQGDLSRLYDTYKKEVARLESQAQEAKERSNDMSVRRNEYQQKWAQESATMSSPELRAAAETRSAKVKERYEGITQKGAAVKEAYPPFDKSLKELQTYLSNDLTREGVSAASPMFQKINKEGQSLSTALDALISELDSVSASMSSAAPK